jgi:hypothetical protein
MEIITDREADLILSWNPCASWRGGSTYMVGCMGECGATGGPMRSHGPREEPGLPDALIFFISFKNKDDVQLYLTICDVLEKLKATDQISINQISYCPSNLKSYLVKEKGNLKTGHETKLAEIEKQNKLIESKYVVLVNKLEKMGCYCKKLGFPTYQTLSDEWYEWKEYVDIDRAKFNICCHKGTKFYQHLKETGVLNKYFPEWYRRCLI